MWYNNKSVIRTHCKAGSQQAWAIVQDLNGWLRIQPVAADAVTNIYMILSMALANGRKVDVFVDNGVLSQATLR